MKLRSRFLLSALIAATVLSAGPARPQGKTFEDTASVVVVEVPVYVTTPDGKPVTGLSAENFEVTEGRKRQEIVGFDVYNLNLDENAGLDPQVPVSARRHFLFLFDLSFSQPAAVVRARDAAIDLVNSSLHPSDLAAVATYSGSQGARLILGFTSDRRQLDIAISTLGMGNLVENKRDPLGLVLTDAADFGVTNQSEVSGGGGNRGAAIIDPEQAAAEILENLERVETSARRATARNSILALTGAMTDLAEMMRSVNGRKHVVYLSEGFDSSILLGTRGDTQAEQRRIQQTNEAAMAGRTWEVDSDERFGSTSTQNQLTNMLQEFVRSDCMIQAVDIGGLRAGGDVRARASSDDGLFIMANDTGGEHYRNFNNLGQAMNKLLERTAVTYVLAIQPAKLKNDGRYRRLKVNLKGVPGKARLSYKPGYYEPKPLAAMTPDERRLATAGMILGNDSGGAVLTSVLAAPFDTGGSRAYVPVLIEIDGESLLGNQKSDVLPTEIYAYALDSQGTVQDSFTQSMGLDVTKVGAALREKGFKFWGNLELPPGDYTLRVLVRNSRSGASSLTGVALEVPEFLGGETALLPPLFPEPAGKWLLGRDPNFDPKRYAYPFLVADQAFIPAARPVLRSQDRAAISLVGYNLGAGELEVKGWLETEDGERIEGVRLSLEERPAVATGMDRLRVTLATGRLPSGRYSLVVEVAEGESTVSSSIPVVVEG